MINAIALDEVLLRSPDSLNAGVGSLVANAEYGDISFCPIPGVAHVFTSLTVMATTVASDQTSAGSALQVV